MTYTVTLGSPAPLDAEERRHRAGRARDLLDGAGWLFDEHISDRTRDLLSTSPGDAAKREEIYRHIDATAQLKGRLLKILETHEAEALTNERKRRTVDPD
jgi:hypothetical protein